MRPAVGLIHLDLHPNSSLYANFIEQEAAQPGVTLARGHFLNAGNEFVAEEAAKGTHELGLVLGLWKPRNTENPVLDCPLLLGDPRTLAEADVVAQYQKFVNWDQSVVNVCANIKHQPTRHRWFYFPRQTAEEVTVFRHRTVDDPYFVNFHAATRFPLPEGMEARSSIETRAYLFFPKRQAPDEEKRQCND